ncbi:hypothetical protein [Candidatus Enterococcus ikei]|uniref:Uncharacterized protein n=1 Tax=Candidatus Enterococcus ikei TaxID=2815326 RepID=A0ABS3H1W1_9ENTE|nr:hypothetical protein [Enterococcus sp. DIV0869a]MBO0441529.1 hypothetical protein [Enterococcus sp. DIV0869a]
MSYKYYYFESPYKAWVIATAPDEAVVAYQTIVSDIQDGVSFSEVTSSQFLDSFASTATDDIPTIERGMKNAAITIRECLFELASENKTAKILAVDRLLV